MPFWLIEAEQDLEKQKLKHKNINDAENENRKIYATTKNEIEKKEVVKELEDDDYIEIDDQI